MRKYVIIISLLAILFMTGCNKKTHIYHCSKTEYNGSKSVDIIYDFYYKGIDIFKLVRTFKTDMESVNQAQEVAKTYNDIPDNDAFEFKAIVNGKNVNYINTVFVNYLSDEDLDGYLYGSDKSIDNVITNFQNNGYICSKLK